MLNSRWFGALLVLGFLGLPAYGQDTADLKWKFKKGQDVFYQEMTTKTEQKMKVMNQEFKQNQEQTFFFSWKILDQDKDKNWIIVQKIEGVKMKIDIGGNPITFDSANPTAPNNPLSEFFKALIGSEFTLTVTPEFKVKEVKGRDEFLKKLTTANPQMEPLLKQILSDDALKQMADPAFSVVPDTAKKKGDSWERNTTLNMGPIGSYDNKYKYTYVKRDDKKIDEIKVETTLKYTPPGDMGMSPLPFKIKSADLKSEEPSGVILFDSENGRIASSEMSIKLKGKLSIEITGMTTEVELDQTQKTTMKTHTKLPDNVLPKK